MTCELCGGEAPFNRRFPDVQRRLCDGCTAAKSHLAWLERWAGRVRFPPTEDGVEARKALRARLLALANRAAHPRNLGDRCFGCGAFLRRGFCVNERHPAPDWGR